MNQKTTEKILPTILIVDDTPANIGVMAENLEEHGYRILVAQDGAEGLQRAEFAQPDLILLDVMMPEMNGLEVCRRLKKQPNTRDIPVIFMTARAETEDKVNGFDAGAVDYVTKPLQIEEVIARIETQIKLSDMQKRLETQNAQLQRYREQLEQRVAERTIELSATNQRLRAEIQERKRAEEQLAIKGAALAQMHEAAYFVDDQARIFYVNAEASRQLGYSREEFLGMSVTDIAPGWTADMVVNAWQGLGEGGANTIEAEHRHKDGSSVPVEISISYMKHNGKAFGLAVVRDITERKRAERELHLLNYALDNSFDATYLVDIDMRLRYVNEAAVRELGYSREELLSMHLTDIDPSIKPEVVRELMRQTAANGRFPGTVESRHRRKNGEIFPIEVGATTFTYEGENLFLTVVRNITERKQAEENLAEREQRYREIFDNSTEGMYLLEVTDDGRFRNLDINPALVKSTGMSREAMIGQFVDDTVPEDVGRVVVEKYRRCVAAGTTIEENIELDLPAGKHYYHSIITPIHYEGRVHRLIGVSRDITELKKAERELEESRMQLRGLTARREEAREEERKYIAREVHDELGQVLTGLQLNISVLEHKFAPDLPPLREHLKDTRVLTDRALGVARNVASALRPAALDMGIHSALEWLAGRFSGNTGIQCEVHFDENEITLDESHAIALFRIVQESLTNVARYAHAGKVDITLQLDGGDYVLSVRDNGKGFDTGTRKMDSFGLVGIRERALMLGGKVVIDSSPGKGTRISVRIPANKKTES